MFTENFKAQKSGKKLYIDYFMGSVNVEVQNDRDAYEYLVTQAATLETLRSNILKEADKFTKE